MTHFAEIFADRPVLADGAMGTVLYARGVSSNRCLDELSLSDPGVILSVHEEYLQAGAEIVETNTFGANRFRLAQYGLSAKVREINLAGVRLARQAVEHLRQRQAGQSPAAVWVAGSVGPLGVRLEPLGKTGLDEAREAFAEQIAALADGGRQGGGNQSGENQTGADQTGVDLMIIETMPALNEARQALEAARAVAPHLPVLVMVTVDDEGNCLDGASATQAAALLTEWGASAIGVNCSTGPTTVLTAAEAMRGATTLPLAAMPNAGMPRAVEGRNIYLCSPEYMASFARKAINAGVQIVGGCCGTTPNHIRAMRSAIRAMDEQLHVERAGAAPVQIAETPPAPLAQRSRIGALIAEKKFVALAEVLPPKGIDCSQEIEGAALLARLGVHGINVYDAPQASARMSGQSLCIQIQQHTGIDTILHYACRDRTLLSIQSDLLGASSIGLHNVLCVTGEPAGLGNYPDATRVFDVDSIGLVNIVHRLNHGLDIGANAIGASTNFAIGVSANPGAPDMENELRRFAYKVEAGAEFCITRPVFDLRLLESFLERTRDHHIPVIAGLWPLASLRNAEYMKNDLRLSMPEEIMLRMAQADTPEAARQEGIRIAQEMLAAVRPYVDGVQVSAPFGNYTAAAEVISSVLPRTP
jgi:methionine synthase I (cobalamin-dependent)/5,10-methylenetetrahydrofolate reductase